MSAQEADFYSGCRKVIRGTSIDFPNLYDDDPVSLSDAGYTRAKLRLLTGHYLHEESREVARQLWDKRRGQGRYGSVSFTTFNHLIKGGSIDAKRSKRASVFGPCIQSVSISWLSKHRAEVDVFYRTTELLKKFPADLVLIKDVLLPPFDFSDQTVGLTCHFANVTVHPMYFVTILPHLGGRWERDLDQLKRKDRRFFDWVVKWTARYVCPEHHRGIAKFAQALRVKKDAMERLDDIAALRSYLRDNHPGHRNDYEEADDDED
jgi:hypothetical protein